MLCDGGDHFEESSLLITSNREEDPSTHTQTRVGCTSALHTQSVRHSIFVIKETLTRRLFLLPLRNNLDTLVRFAAPSNDMTTMLQCTAARLHR